MKRLGAVLAGPAFAAALLIALAAATLLALEQTGALARFLRDQIARELGAAGDALQIGGASLRWFDPGLELTDVRIEAEQGYLHFDRIEVAVQPALLPLQAVRHVQVAGGRVLYSPSLARLLQATVRTTDTGRPDREHRPELPRLRVRDLAFALHTPRAGDLALGSLDLVVEMDRLRLFRASGVLRPPPVDGGPPATVHFSGHEDVKNRFRLRAASRGVPLPWSPSVAGRERPVFDGTLSLEADGTFHLDGSGPTEAHARLSVADAYFDPGEIPPVEDVSAELAVSFTSVEDLPYWHLPAWDVTAHVAGQWAGSPVSAWAVAGAPADGGAVAWASIPGVDLDEPALRRVYAAVGIERDMVALEPSGTLGVAAGARLAWRDDALELPPRLLLHLTPGGTTGVTFRGWPSSTTGNLEGIPLPCTELTGAFVLAGQGQPFAWRAGLVDLDGRVAADGRVRARGSLRSTARALEPVDLDLEIAAEGVAIDDVLRDALDGMEATRSLWRDYGPRTGRVDSAWRLVRNDATVGVLPEGRVTVREGAAAWSEVPVPADDVAGDLHFRWGARGTPVTTPLGLRSTYRPFGLTYAFAGKTRTVEAVSLRGFSREEFPPGEVAVPAPDAQRLRAVHLEVAQLPLRGSDWDVLATALPDTAAEIDELQARGKVDVVYDGWRARSDGPARTAVEAEVEPDDLVLHPRRFPMRTEGVRGRVCVRLDEPVDLDGAPPPEPVLLATVAGRWTGDVTVAAFQGAPRRGRPRIVVYAAGADPGNAALRGSVSAALTEATGDRVDFSALAVTGRVDVRAELPLEDESGEPAGSLRLHLRENDLTLRNFGLNALRGVLVLRDGVLRGERVMAVLGRTPVELRDAAFLSSDRVADFPLADPMLLEAGLLPPEPVTVLQADLHARDLPLDRVHLEGLLDEESLRALVDEAGLVGRLDLLGARCILVGDGAGGSVVAVRGRLLPHGISLDSGFPAQISSAQVELHRLLYEQGRLRAWGNLDDLYGRVAGREISRASCVLGYIDGRLSIQGLDGAFEGGRIRSLGRPGTESAALHLDVAEPFRFDVAVSFEDVDVDGVLEGVFPSNVRDTGRLNAQLRLAGSLDDPLGLVGSGSGFISGARLWSIPVVRELFSQLGFDGTAVFDRMSCRFRLRDGVVSFPEVRARSPLLHLVGRDGTARLDGRLDFDLEVRYSLIDQLGPINRLVYWIQNNLLRVSIRGDMARPRVVLRNSLRELFGAPDLESQELPLPELTPLPDRF